MTRLEGGKAGKARQIFRTEIALVLPFTVTERLNDDAGEVSGKVNIKHRWSLIILVSFLLVEEKKTSAESLSFSVKLWQAINVESTST